MRFIPRLILIVALCLGSLPINWAAAQGGANAESSAAEPTESGQSSDTGGAATTSDDSTQPAESDPRENADQSAEESPGVMGSVRDFFHTPPLGYLFEGGIFMWPILLMGILGAGVIIERYRSLKMLSTDSSFVRQRVQELLETGHAQEAFELCNAEQGPVPAILATGLRKYLVLERLGYNPAKVEEQVVKSMDDYGIHIVAALERHLAVLATISSVAPMLGFLGTVQGMIVAFNDIILKMGETNIIVAAASGLMVSLMTTCFGLIVGIPAFIAFNYFTSVINRFVLDVEESATELIETVTLKATLSGERAQLAEETL